MIRAGLILLLVCACIYKHAAQQCITGRYAETAIFDSSEISIISEIEYGIAQHAFTGEDVSLRMDIYQPLPLNYIQPYPLLLLIHGGGFIGGDKSELAYQAMEFARRGFVVANINYRTGWNCDNTLCINCYGSNLQKAVYCAVQDARAALRYIHAHAMDWSADHDYIFVGGESAGSITAMLAAFWNQEEADSEVAASFSAFAGGLNNAGNDLPNDYDIRGVINQCGAIPELSHMLNNDIPMISFHDSNDCVVPYQSGPLIACFCSGFLYYHGSSAIHTYRINNNQCSELHTAQQLLPNHCSYPDLNLVKLSACFMKRVMCGFCMSFADSDINSTPVCATLHETEIYGCSYEGAVNFDPAVTADDGSCYWEIGNYCLGDLNEDGLVNTADVLLIIANFGHVCPY